MHGTEIRPLNSEAAINSLRSDNHPRVLITGASTDVGRACAEMLFARGAELVLCDKDVATVTTLAKALGATGLVCEVASEASVRNLATEVLGRYSSFDMVINAAGGGYERTLGMYRVSRAIIPALCRGGYKLLVNIPPSLDEADTAIFPYASSRHAFYRLSAALALETRRASVAVMIGCPTTGRVTRVLPDPDAGTWVESCNIRPLNPDGAQTLAWQIASLFGVTASDRRRAS